MAGDERFWVARARWRLRGAMLWPAFVVLTLVDGLVLYRLSPVGFDFKDPIAPVIMATFGNLFLIAVVAPLLTRRLAARRPGGLAQVEREVLGDRVGTALLAAGVVGVVAAGLGNRQVVVSETEATERNAAAVSEYVAHTRSPELIRNKETANTHRLSEGYFRTCIARDDRRRHFCLFVDTKKRPAEVVRDRSQVPNQRLFPNAARAASTPEAWRPPSPRSPSPSPSCARTSCCRPPRESTAPARGRSARASPPLPLRRRARFSRLRQSSSVSFHALSGSFSRLRKRLSCSSSETCIQNLTNTMPSAAFIRSNSTISS